MCHLPTLDRSGTLVRETSAMLAATVFIIVFRIFYKIFDKTQKPWWDDWLLVVLLLLGGGPLMVITIFVMAPNGIGRDIWTLSFDQIDTLFKFMYIELASYYAQIALLKIVFLCFFLRIFTTRNTRRVIFGTMAVSLMWGIASTLVGLFQCWPIPYNWVWDGSTGGKCVDKSAILIANAVISIALDLWILAIPIWKLRHLNVSGTKKLGVALMFLTGGL